MGAYEFKDSCVVKVSPTTPLSIFSAVSPLLMPLFAPFSRLGADEFSAFLSIETLFVFSVMHIPLALSTHATGKISRLCLWYRFFHSAHLFPFWVGHYFWGIFSYK